MSYYLTKSLSFDKNFNECNLNIADSSLRPLDYFKTSVKRKEEVAKIEFIKGIVKDILDGNFQLKTQNNIIATIEIVKERYGVKHNRELWHSPYDFGGKYDSDKKEYVYKSEEDKLAYQNAMKQKESIVSEIAAAIFNRTYDKRIVEMRKKKFIVGYASRTSYVCEIRKDRIVVSSDINKAKQFSVLEGFNKEFWFESQLEMVRHEI